MDYKLVFENFKKQYTVDGKFTFHLFPVLFSELFKYGADHSIVSQDFINDFLTTFLSNEKTQVHLIAINCITHYKLEFLPSEAVLIQPVVKDKIVSEVKPNIVIQDSIHAAKVNPIVEKSPNVIVKNTTPFTQIHTSPPIPQIQYNDPIPEDDGNDDGTFIPEEERLYIKSEDLPTKQYDWDFIKKIGIVNPEDNP